MHATTPAEDVVVRTTMSEDTATCVPEERGAVYSDVVSTRGAVQPSVHAATTSKDVAVRTMVSKGRPRVPRGREGAVCSDMVGTRAITV